MASTMWRRPAPIFKVPMCRWQDDVTGAWHTECGEYYPDLKYIPYDDSIELLNSFVTCCFCDRVINVVKP